MTALALALPTALGMLAWIALLGRPRGAAAWAACCGSGYVVGGVGFGMLLRFAAPLPLADWPQAIGVPCALLAGVAVALLWQWRSRIAVVQAPTAPPLNGLSRALLALIVVLLLAHLWTLAVQSIALPTVGWDAWAAWLAKARAWTGAGELLPLADFDAWWASAPGTSRYALAAHYPDALPRLLTWVAAMHGGWYEPAVHAAWPVLWLALLGVLFGHLRMAGAGRVFAAVIAYLVTSLPLLNTHVALAGYADLWLAALLLIVFVHLQRAFAARSWRDALFALLAALLLPAVKLEGAVWMLCVLLAAVIAMIPARWQLRLLPVAAIGLALVIAIGGVRIPLPGLGVVALQWGMIEIPTIGRLALYWRPVLPEVLESLFLLPNWHLLWYLLPLAAAARLGAGLREQASQVGLLAVAFGYGFLFVLFFFTDASAWAESLTSVNRVLLQIVPATAFCVSLLYVARPVPRGRWA